MFKRGKMMVDLVLKQKDVKQTASEKIATGLQNASQTYKESTDFSEDSSYSRHDHPNSAQSDILIIPFDSAEELTEINSSCGVSVVHCGEFAVEPSISLQVLEKLVESIETNPTCEVAEIPQVLENIEYSVNEINLFEYTLNAIEAKNDNNKIAGESSFTSEKYVPEEEENDSTSDNSEDDETSPVEILPQPTTSKEVLVPGEIKKTRKRQAEPDTWRKTERKVKRMSGKSYETRKNTVMPEKKPSYINCSRCRFKCSEKISLERQQILHQEYWGLADAGRQKARLCSLVTENSIQRHRKRKPESKITKTKSRVYSLPDGQGCECA